MDIILYGVGSSVGAGIYSLIGVGVSTYVESFRRVLRFHWSPLLKKTRDTHHPTVQTNP